MHLIGEVEGRHCVIMDDIIDTGGTLCKAAEALKDRGAKGVTAYCTHAVLSGGATLIFCLRLKPYKWAKQYGVH
jgi:ribose-phosphate pyrophosphokinase